MVWFFLTRSDALRADNGCRSGSFCGRWVSTLACILILAVVCPVIAQELRVDDSAGGESVERRDSGKEQEDRRRRDDDAQLTSARRLIHHFDFDEREDGNLESTPKFWIPFEGDSFPRYATGAFDDEVGYEDPPSLRLQTQGRNAAYRYNGLDTEVDTRSEYLIVAWVRGEHLEHARAALSAYYMDHNREPIVETQVFSELVGGDPEDMSWHRVELYLPVGPRRSATIGVTAWVVQPEVWDQRPREKRHIDAFDVEAGAWIDDIRIFRLPRVLMRTNAPGNVIGAEQGAALFVSVVDSSDTEVQARLTVEDFEGQVVADRPLPLHSEISESPIRIPLAGFEDGLYRARVWVSARGVTLAQRILVFAKIHWAEGDKSLGNRAFGISLAVESATPPQLNLAMLRKLNVGAVKIPVWSGSQNIPDLVDAGEGMDAMLYGLLKARVSITGVLAGPPASHMRSAGAYSVSLLTLLSEKVELWDKELVRVFAPYSSVFTSWQIGSDEDVDLAVDPQRWVIADRVRQAMAELNTAMRLTVPGTVSWFPEEQPPGENKVSYVIEDFIQPDYIGDHLAAYRDAGWPLTSAYLKMSSDPMEGVDLDVRLGEWCKRLIMTRHAGVETIYVPQVWHTRYGPEGAVTEPDPEFLILHTVIRTLGESTPAGDVYVAPGVTALAFEHEDEVVLALWDQSAGDWTRKHTIQLGGRAHEVIDMWGLRRPIELAIDGRHIIELSRNPVFVRGVEKWMLTLRTLLTFTPNPVAYTIGTHQHRLSLVNPHRVPLAGSIELGVPEEWSIVPRIFRFSVPAGETFEKRLEVQFPRNETAGERQLMVEADIEAERRFRFKIPLTIRLGSDDLEVWGVTFTEGDKLIVLHSMTNHTNESLNLKSTTAAPGRVRQNRKILDFLPGQTMTFEYHFPRASQLHGREIRLNLREINGSRIHNIVTIAE